MYLPKRDMQKTPLVSFVSLFILIKIFVKGIYCLFSIFCSDVAVLDITLWSMKTQNINASHSRKNILSLLYYFDLFSTLYFD